MAASASRVWDMLTDVGHWYEWTPSIRAIDALDGQPLYSGSRYRIRQPWLPAAIWTITAREPGESFLWKSEGALWFVSAEHRIVPVGHESRVEPAM